MQSSSIDEFKGPLPPHVQLRDFLSRRQRKELLSWVTANQARFAPARVTDKGGNVSRLSPAWRVAFTLRDLGPFENELRKRLLEALPLVMAGTGTSGPEPVSLELELAAYGDGAHYAPHIDVSTGANRKALGAQSGEDRLLSAVYYFHSDPKAFSGGELRLYRFGADPAEQKGPGDDHFDVDPVQNSLVAFPSWARHEVRPVRCPSGDFRDYRFSLNCWYCRAIAQAPD